MALVGGVMEKIYTGIGSRETPNPILILMTAIAGDLEKRGWVLRSGGASGADAAFEQGVKNKSHSVIYRPEHTTLEAMQLAAKFHPAWDRCSAYARKLHGRNCFQILGITLDNPTKFVVCWTKDGKASGGTGQAIRMAEAYSIPVFNLHDLNNLHYMYMHVQHVEREDHYGNGS